MDVTALPMVTEVRLSQPLNVSFSIRVTELGIVTEVMPSQSLKHFSQSETLKDFQELLPQGENNLGSLEELLN